MSLTAAVLPGRALAWGSYTAQFSLLQTTEKKKRRKRNPVEHIGYSLVTSSTCALRDCTHRHTNYSRTSSRANRHVFFFFSLEFLFTTTHTQRQNPQDDDFLLTVALHDRRLPPCAPASFFYYTNQRRRKKILFQGFPFQILYKFEPF